MKLVMCMVDFLIPVLMLAFGLVFWRCPSREVDKWYGYRTRRAVKSPEAYVYAQTRMGKIWSSCSIPLAGLTLAAVLFWKDSGSFEDVVSLLILAIQLAVMLLGMIPVECSLKRKFG